MAEELFYSSFKCWHFSSSGGGEIFVELSLLDVS